MQFSLAYAKVRRTSKNEFALPSQLLAQRFRDALLPGLSSAPSLFSEIDSYEDLATKALSIERAQTRPRTGSPATRTGFTAVSNSNGGGNVQQSNTSRVSTPRRVRCWNCDAEGHVAYDCPDPIERAFRFAGQDGRGLTRRDEDGYTRNGARDQRAVRFDDIDKIARRTNDGRFRRKPRNRQLNCCIGKLTLLPNANTESEATMDLRVSATSSPLMEKRPSAPVSYADLDGDLFLLVIKLGGQQIHALIDSGASSNFVNRLSVPATCTIATNVPMSVRGFHGATDHTLGRITAVCRMHPLRNVPGCGPARC